MSEKDAGMVIKKVLGLNIKLYRSQKGLSQVALAEKIGISKTFLSTIERGLKYPTAKVLAKLAQSLDVDVWMLYNDGTIKMGKEKIPLNQLSNDLKQKVNEAIETILKKYSA
jgi:XRE family transcriptional regulator of biofilm formation